MQPTTISIAEALASRSRHRDNSTSAQPGLTRKALGHPPKHLQGLQGLVLFVTLLASITSAFAATVSVPLQLGPGFLEQQVSKQVFVDAGKTFTAWNDGSGCNHLVLSEPKTNSAASGFRLRMKGEGRVGSPVGDLCIPLVPWSGYVDVLLKPSVEPRSNSIRLNIADSSISDSDGKATTGGAVWNWTKQYVHPRLAAIHIDFDKPLADLRTIAPLLFPYNDSNQLREVLASLNISGVTTSEEGLKVQLSMEVPNTRSRMPGPAESILSSTELARIDEALNYWDAFVTLVAKQAAMSSNNNAVREQLLSILLNARYEIMQHLSKDNLGSEDPVRELFLDTWVELAPILKKISIAIPDETALDFVAFIGAIDALKAIDAVGPGLDLDISTDGLRRLARMIAPAGVENPLLYNEEVDPEMRRLFDFGEPIELPGPPPAPSSSWFINTAWAQSSWDRSTLFDLNKWIPTGKNIHGYLVRVRWLLEDVVYKVLRDKPLDDSFQDVFHPLMLASAWQETCWRQFVIRGGERTPITSSAGAVGIMQVSPRVWRGFYQPKALTWNIHYNAMAGGEILHHYLVRYAIRNEEHLKTKNVHNLARATYSAYHGGPSHLTRYRSKKTSRALRKIDRSFWLKYETVRDGDSLAVKQCYS